MPIPRNNNLTKMKVEFLNYFQWQDCYIFGGKDLVNMRPLPKEFLPGTFSPV